MRLFLITTLLLAIPSVSAFTYQNVTWTPLNETSTDSFKDLISRFSTARDYGSVGYTEAQRFIEEWFTDLNMTFIRQTFDTFNDSITGTNLIGVLPGEMSANATHRFYLVGAHYDTMKDNPGVTDNGSGRFAYFCLHHHGYYSYFRNVSRAGDSSSPQSTSLLQLFHGILNSVCGI